MKIPDNITIGGQIIDVKLIDHLDNGYLGQISLGESEIVIAQNFNGRKQHQESINSTFIHEIIHGILDTIRETELSSNEKFVNTFAGYLYQIIKQIKD